MWARSPLGDPWFGDGRGSWRNLLNPWVGALFQGLVKILCQKSPCQPIVQVLAPWVFQVGDHEKEPTSSNVQLRVVGSCLAMMEFQKIRSRFSCPFWREPARSTGKDRALSKKTFYQRTFGQGQLPTVCSKYRPGQSPTRGMLNSLTNQHQDTWVWLKNQISQNPSFEPQLLRNRTVKDFSCRSLARAKFGVSPPVENFRPSSVPVGPARKSSFPISSGWCSWNQRVNEYTAIIRIITHGLWIWLCIPKRFSAFWASECMHWWSSFKTLDQWFIESFFCNSLERSAWWFWLAWSGPVAYSFQLLHQIRNFSATAAPALNGCFKQLFVAPVYWSKEEKLKKLHIYYKYMIWFMIWLFLTSNCLRYLAPRSL